MKDSPPPQVQLHPVVHLDDDPDYGKEHHQAPETKTEEEHESFIHGPSLPVKGKTTTRCSGQGGDGVGPCLNGGENRVGLVGGDTDLFAAEGHVVDLPAGVVALDGGRIPLTLAVVHRVSAHCGGHLGITEDLGLHGVEAGNGTCPCGDGPHGVRFIILVEDPGGISFPGLLHRGHLPAGGLIRGTPKRVGGQDCLHDGVEGSHVSDRGSECPDG